MLLSGSSKRKYATKSASDLSAGYESNFGMEGDEGSAGGLVGTAKGVESVVIAVTYRRYDKNEKSEKAVPRPPSLYSRLVGRLVDRLQWLKGSQDNLALYGDVRSLMNYVKNAHGGVFRRVAIGALIESAQKIVKSSRMEDPALM